MLWNNKRIGVYNCYRTMKGKMIYDKIDEKYYKFNNVIHPLKAELFEYIDYYFDNINLYTRYSKSGVRAILLHGPQGTGKTSLIKNLMAAHSTKSFVKVSDFGTLQAHALKCAKDETPCIMIYEDCEASLNNMNPSIGYIKDFLSGSYPIQFTKGCFIIFTTNYPEYLSNTIIFRKGRIDKMFEISRLKDEHLMECVKFYFADLKIDKDKLYDIFKNEVFSGSEVESIADDSKTVAAKRGKELEVDIIAEVIKDNREEYEKIKKMKDNQAYNRFDDNFGVSVGAYSSRKIGFK